MPVIPPPTFLLDRMLARCSLRHVQVLLMAAETGTLRGAAEAVGISPGSLERMLSGLEETLDTELFRRAGDSLEALPACAELLPHARQIVAAVAGAAEALAAHQRGHKIVVRVLASGPAAHRLLTQAVPAFTARYARVQVEWGAADGRDPAAASDRSAVDFVVGPRPAAVPPGWAFHELLTDRFAVVCSPDHPLAGAARATREELARHAWLLPPVGSAAREHFDDLALGGEAATACYCVISDIDEIATWLARDPEVLAFVPVSDAVHLLLEGELVQVRTVAPDDASLGLLQPPCCTEPALRLAGFLGNFAASCPEAARA
jgi:DNA-binding transcriptional LysR family regulator